MYANQNSKSCSLLPQFELSRDTYLQACEHFPSCLGWLGLGIAFYKVNQSVKDINLETTSQQCLLLLKSMSNVV